jgi:hypothetical protein
VLHGVEQRREPRALGRPRNARDERLAGDVRERSGRHPEHVDHLRRQPGHVVDEADPHHDEQRRGRDDLHARRAETVDDAARDAHAREARHAAEEVEEREALARDAEALRDLRAGDELLCHRSTVAAARAAR